MGNKTGFRGVTCIVRLSGKPSFQASIRVRGVTARLGSFPTAELAYGAYLAARIRMGGRGRIKPNYSK